MGTDLEDRVAVVTGGAGGIGQAIVAALRRAGAMVVVWDRNLPTGDADDGIAVDVTDRAALDRAVAVVRGRHGRLDILVNNAGHAGPTVPLVDYPEDEWRRILEVNLTGTFLACKAAVPALVANGWGRIVNVASLAGKEGTPNASAYSASKAGVISYLESLRVELHGSGVRVVTIAPGYIRTPMTDVNDYPMPFLMASDAAARRMLGMIEAGRRFGVVPWQMAVVARLLAAIPRPVFDRLFSRAGRKPRGLPL